MGSSYRILLRLPGGESKTIEVGENQHIWDAAYAAGLELPSICHQGRCLTCAGRLLAPGDFDSSDAVAYFPQDRSEGFILLCTARPRSDLEIETHQQYVMREHRKKLGLPAPYS
jgi:ferredoxin